MDNTSSIFKNTSCIFNITSSIFNNTSSILHNSTHIFQNDVIGFHNFRENADKGNVSRFFASLRAVAWCLAVGKTRHSMPCFKAGTPVVARLHATKGIP